MLKFRAMLEKRRARAAAKAALPTVSDDALAMSDRAAPAWTRGMSYVFATTGSLSLLSVAILAVYMHAAVIEDGHIQLAWILGIAGIVPVLGALVMDYAHARALNGYRDARRRSDAAAKCALGALSALALALVHPLLGMGIVLGGALGWLGAMALRALSRAEPLWDFRPSEAVGVLAGRDCFGHRLAAADNDGGEFAIWPAIRQASVWIGILAAMALTTWLAAREIVSLSAIVGIVLITFWAVAAICDYCDIAVRDGLKLARVAQRVDHTPLSDEAAIEHHAGLLVRNLSVEDGSGRRLLSDIHLEVPPGTIVGVRGEAGAGKSLLLRALSDPHGLAELHVRGHVSLNDADLWMRTAQHEHVPCVHLPEDPVLLAASGADNLACFHSGAILERGKRILEQLVFATDTVDQICAAPNALNLSSTQKKSLAIARAFLLNPNLYLMDRPEDSASDKLIRALTARIMQEKRLGRSFILATDDRAMLECCDMLLVLQGGRVIEAGDAEEIRGRMSSGWARMVAARSLESEDNLDRWIRSHFKRDGDEANRRKAALIASELLAFSCQSSGTLDGRTITLEFKHFEGHCILKMLDDDGPVTTAQLERAREEAERQTEGARLTPLALVIAQSLSVEAVMDGDKRAVIAKIATYDPRKTRNPQKNGDLLGAK